ncbi:MAG TPA: hypothetical protein VFA90_02010 [Terriglobales bacterium]|nr:hypothetical protein [Terriglobales bacterium]
MSKKRVQRDPAAAYVRNATAARRIGDRMCSCGEKRPWALDSKSEPLRCYECLKREQKISTSEDHHPAGSANDPDTTIPVPANDHRAELSTAQYDWPRKTLENPEGSPLLARAAKTRGFMDTNDYLIRRLLASDPEFDELLDAFLTKKLGPQWWKNSELEKFALER